MKYFVIENATQTIVNAILVDPQNLPEVGSGYSLSATGGNIGDTWNGSAWVTPAPIVTRSNVREERDRRLQDVASGYTQIERNTWPAQVEEAKAYKADNTASTPMLSALAAARNLTVDQMADKVLRRNAAFAAATGQIMGAATILLGMEPIPDNMTDDIWWT